MNKNNLAFKQIRRRVACQNSGNCQNIPINIPKPSPLILIKTENKIPLISVQNTLMNNTYKFPSPVQIRKCKTQNNTFD